MSSLQVQARALGDPTRFRIFEHLLAADGPVGVAELTDQFQLNHNAIRQHLAKLVGAGLVVESSAAPVGRGRPRLQYAVDPASEGRWGGVGPYERLSLLLVEVVRGGDSPVEVGRRAGLRRRLSDRPHGAPDDLLVEQMARWGFDPVAQRRGEELHLTLRACPFASAVLADPDTVCGLHLGLARGVAEAVGGVEVEELVPRDPRRAHCRLRCRLTGPPDHR